MHLDLVLVFIWCQCRRTIHSCMDLFQHSNFKIFVPLVRCIHVNGGNKLLLRNMRNDGGTAVKVKGAYYSASGVLDIWLLIPSAKNLIHILKIEGEKEEFCRSCPETMLFFLFQFIRFFCVSSIEYLSWNISILVS